MIKSSHLRALGLNLILLSTFISLAFGYKFSINISSITISSGLFFIIFSFQLKLYGNYVDYRAKFGIKYSLIGSWLFLLGVLIVEIIKDDVGLETSISAYIFVLMLVLFGITILLQLVEEKIWNFKHRYSPNIFLMSFILGTGTEFSAFIILIIGLVSMYTTDDVIYKLLTLEPLLKKKGITKTEKIALSFLVFLMTYSIFLFINISIFIHQIKIDSFQYFNRQFFVCSLLALSFFFIFFTMFFIEPKKIFVKIASVFPLSLTVILSIYFNTTKIFPLFERLFNTFLDTLNGTDKIFLMAIFSLIGFWFLFHQILNYFKTGFWSETGVTDFYLYLFLCFTLPILLIYYVPSSEKMWVLLIFIALGFILSISVILGYVRTKINFFINEKIHKSNNIIKHHINPECFFPTIFSMAYVSLISGVVLVIISLLKILKFSQIVKYTPIFIIIMLLSFIAERNSFKDVVFTRKLGKGGNK